VAPSQREKQKANMGIFNIVGVVEKKGGAEQGEEGTRGQVDVRNLQ